GSGPLGVLGDPAGGFLARGGTGDDHKMLVVKLVDGDIIDDAAFLVAHRRVAHLPRFQILDFVDEQAVEDALGSRPFYVHLAHRGNVLNSDIGARVGVLVCAGGVGDGEHVVAA